MGTSDETAGTARVGCSGWDYRSWRGPVYPTDLPHRRWFDHYAATFDTVEINATFYRLPTDSSVERWREQAPLGFRYAVKVGSYGTHRKHLRDPDAWLSRHLKSIRGLGPTMGPNLVQLPPHWHRDAGRLDAFLAAAPTKTRWAVEFRDPEWLHDSVFDVLAAHEAALVIHDLIPDHPWERTAPFTYLRFHGPDAPDHPYGGRYTGRRLWRPAKRLASWLDEGCDVYAYFNNDQGGHAFEDARWLADRLRDTSSESS